MKTSNFSNLLRNFEEKFTECNWNVANGGFSLAEEILEQIKLVGDMEQDVSSKEKSSKGLENAITAKESELSKNLDHLTQIKSEFDELESSKNILTTKHQSRQQKLQILSQKQSEKVDDF